MLQFIESIMYFMVKSSIVDYSTIYSTNGPFNGTKEWQNWISEMERE